jgi:catechol-2,3-dioxygenase
VGSLSIGPVGQVSLSIREVPRAERFYRDRLGLPHLFTFGDLAFFDAAGERSGRSLGVTPDAPQRRRIR